MLAYSNCSNPLRLAQTTQGSDTKHSIEEGIDDEGYSILLSDGSILALQDKTFKFLIPGFTAGGTVTGSGLPSWVVLNSEEGIMNGVPTKMSDGATFQLSLTDSSGNTSSLGPWKILIFGNPLKEYQWHLTNTGQAAFAATAGIAGEDIHMAKTIASNITGKGVRVAISDSGTVLAHPGLTDNVLPNESRNYFNDYEKTKSWIGDPTPEVTKSTPGNAHGTAVAGLAVEAGWNDVGGRGVAPDASFAAFLFVQAQEKLSTAGLYTTGLNDQFKGDFDIFNYSWGDPQCALIDYSDTYSTTLGDGVTNQRQGLGSIYVMAGGNSYVEDLTTCWSGVSSANVFGNTNFSGLQTTPYTLSIAAVNAHGYSASYSTPGSSLWVSAPGGEFGLDKVQTGYPNASEPALISTDFPECDLGIKAIFADKSQFGSGKSLNSSCDYVSTMNGTSGAAPVATGAIALMLQVNPSLSWRDVKYILAKTADQINSTVNPATHPDKTLNLAGHTYDLGWVTNKAGFHFQNYYGFGRINVDKAVDLARDFKSPLGAWQESGWAVGSMTDPSDSSKTTKAVPNGKSEGLSKNVTISQDLTIEAVQLRINLTGCAGDMGLELKSPQGTQSILMNINSRIRDQNIDDHIFLTNAFYGEKSLGQWTLKVVDGHSSCSSGALQKWELNFFGY